METGKTLKVTTSKLKSNEGIPDREEIDNSTEERLRKYKEAAENGDVHVCSAGIYCEEACPFPNYSTRDEDGLCRTALCLKYKQGT